MTEQPSQRSPVAAPAGPSLCHANTRPPLLQTMQCSAFLSGLLQCKLIRCVDACDLAHSSAAWHCAAWNYAAQHSAVCICWPSGQAQHASECPAWAHKELAPAHECRRAIVIAPKTLLAHWARELGVCGVGRMTHEYFGSESER